MSALSEVFMVFVVYVIVLLYDKGRAAPNARKMRDKTLKLNGTDWDFVATSNETHSFIYFAYTHRSIYEVTIQGTWVIPEFPSAMILSPLTLATLIAAITLRKKRKQA